MSRLLRFHCWSTHISQSRFFIVSHRKFEMEGQNQALVEIGPGFWNLRGSFTFAEGFEDLGTHMSLLQLASGKFLVVDACDISDKAKAEIDLLTENGRLMDAIVATHPYHTTYFPLFHRLYPEVKLYGTPRHLRHLPSLPWTDNVNNAAVRSIWESEGVFMRIPAGADFVQAPFFMSMFVFHQPSRTLHDDDTINYSQSVDTGPAGKLEFHPDMLSGFYATEEAPMQFLTWITTLLNDWDIDNLCTAHNHYKRGDAHRQLQALVDEIRPQLEALSASNKLLAASHTEGK